MPAEIIVVFVYFAGVLVIGLYSFFRVNQPGDYYVAGKKAGLVPVTGSLLATILGGSAILGTIEFSQRSGWPALWFLFSAAVGLFILVPLSRRVKRTGNYTLPGMLGYFYGKRAQKIASAIIPFAWMGIVAAQIIAAAKILHGMELGSYTWSAIIAGVIFIFYTLLGGQVSILKTDTLQAVIIVAGIAAALYFSVTAPQNHVAPPFTFTGMFNKTFEFPDLLVLLLTYSVTFVVGPDIYSRMFCAKNEKTAAGSVLIVAILLLPISLMLTWLGIISVDSAGSGAGIIGFAHHLLPSWAYGLFAAALLSAVMSSADTTLLTTSMISVELFTGDLDKKNALFYTRIFVVVFGIAGIVIALFVTSIIQSLLFALTFFSGAFVVPVLAGLLNIRPSEKVVNLAIVLGGFTALGGKIIAETYDKTTGHILILFAYVIHLVLYSAGALQNMKRNQNIIKGG